MSNQYAGGFISKTPPTVTTSSAQGMWTLSQQAQYQKAGTWPFIPPTTIGQAYGGGFYAGKINVSGTQYYLIVAPKSSGYSSSKSWGPSGSSTGVTSVIDGPGNSNTLNSSTYPAVYFCKTLTIGGYTDWYLPAKNELEVLYYFLKPTSSANDTASGSNANAVSPEPVSTNYTSGSPAQTTAAAFQSGGAEYFTNYSYWSSSEYNSNYAWMQNIGDNGYQNIDYPKNFNNACRAVRRIPV